MEYDILKIEIKIVLCKTNRDITSIKTKISYLVKLPF